MARLIFNNQEIADVTYSGGGDSIELLDSGVYFDNEMIRLPIALNANHKVFLDFQLDAYTTQMQILGNSAGNTSNFYVGLWNGLGANNFYVRTSDGEHYQVLSDYTARHTLAINDNGAVKVDDTSWYNGTINTASNVYYTIGYRGNDALGLTGTIFRFYIYDTVNDEYLIDLRPAKVGSDGEPFLYDVINKVGYGKVPKS